MENPKFLKILNKAVIFGIVVSAVSFVIPLIPCKKAPVIADPVYTWSICKLANPFQQLVGISQKFYNISTDNSAGLILQFLVATALFLIVFTLFRKKAGKILDLTNK
ncbi:MAG: hypothetical protein AABW67_02960 [Nanoarchaeota archaeon]